MKDEDPFSSLFELEETFYNEGYDLGVLDGKRVGLVEGRLTGLERGFEKYAAMGRINGKCGVWAGRLVQRSLVHCNEAEEEEEEEEQRIIGMLRQADAEEEQRTIGILRQADAGEDGKSSQPQRSNTHHPSLPPFPSSNPRLAKHIRTLYALVEPASLPIENTEDAVSDFDDRFKRAEGKVKIIEKITGELDGKLRVGSGGTSGDGSIEDSRSVRGARR